MALKEALVGFWDKVNLLTFFFRGVQMAGQMTKSQIADAIAKEHELTKKSAVAILESLVTLAYSQAKNGFTIPGLGKLVLVQRKARMGRNPQTGEAIKIPAKKVCKFRIAKACKDAVLGPKKK